jgi:uncharacterized protein
MQQKISFKVLPTAAADLEQLRLCVAKAAGQAVHTITGYHILKRSIDARSRPAWINFTVTAFINEPFRQRTLPEFTFKEIGASAKKVVVIGSGPAGLFAALRLIELGIKPVILERGKPVKERRRDLALLNREGVINSDSNYCFGEGGAGTYSDGKLYTRSTKRGNIDRILHIFVYFGADESILYEAHPHIGTNKLPDIITAMRKRIIDCGGEFHFHKKVVDFDTRAGSVTIVKTEDGEEFTAHSYILATGHSARDIFTLLRAKQVEIIAKPFALGVRVEHPQSLVNNIQYGYPPQELPPASYSLAQQVDERGVFSFCMCPGGIIAPASTSDGELVVNGWSPSKRNNPYANSGLVVQVEVEDVYAGLAAHDFHTGPGQPNDPMMMMHFQQQVEQKAYIAGGGKFVAPAQRMVDFVEGHFSSTLPGCSYIPGIHSVSLDEVLPRFIGYRLKKGLRAFAKKMRTGHGHEGFYTNEAVLVATESRTSSPVRIPRDAELLNHPALQNLFPCGEGGGYAGGIVSAAMDGERVAQAIAVQLHVTT